MSRPASILDRAISPAEAVEMLCMQELAERCENMQGEVGENRGKRFSTCSVIHKNLNLWTGKPRSALFQKVKADE